MLCQFKHYQVASIASIAAVNLLVSPAARPRATLLHNPLTMIADTLLH